MEPARSADRGFFPLDEELDLDGSDLTPQAHEGLVRLASWVPFEPAAQLLEALVGVRVSKSSARRFTLGFRAGRLAGVGGENQSTPAGASRRANGSPAAGDECRRRHGSARGGRMGRG